ncbi:MAG: M23 family metallopeptidase [Clostridiales bacterium]|jgi:murein DD-endopeptidase MepM/ murein hydrolase activator NlpD|nr:M23 family metallopeptidase [Clostridiales bacterium]
MTKEILLARMHVVLGYLRKYSTRIGALLIIVAVLAAAAGMNAHAGSYTYVVYLDNEEIGFVPNEAEILEYVDALHEQEAERYGLPVKPLQEVRVEREQRPGIQPDEWTVKDQLRRELEYDVYAYVIIVNDKPTLAVRAIEDYDRVIEELKGAYVSGKDNSVIQAVVLNDQVEARLTLVDPDALYSADKAADILRRGTDRSETYLVSRGDSLWTIARSNNMTVGQIQQANPQLGDSDRLQPGEELNLVVADPFVSVSVTEEVMLTQRIPFETKYQNDSKMYKGATKVITPGKYGYKEVTYRITQTNGSEVQREILGEVIIEEPQTQVVARGTAAAPVAGTGRFLWPVSGGGRITSRYGMRGSRFHYGVDIGSSSGTAVLAADSGTVTFAGWGGAYGNLISIDHGNGYATKYAHNSSILVSVGQKVSKGSQIARVGSTGNSTGPHLHFEVLRNGSNVNPLNFF